MVDPTGGPTGRTAPGMAHGGAAIRECLQKQGYGETDYLHLAVGEALKVGESIVDYDRASSAR